MNDDDEMLLIASSPIRDPARLEVAFPQNVFLDDKWRLAILEISLPNKIALFNKAEDFIEISRVQKTRTRRSLDVSEAMSDIPVSLVNFFPWTAHFMSIKKINQTQLLAELINPQFSTLELSQILGITQLEAITYQRAVIHFCERIHILKLNGSIEEVWILNQNGGITWEHEILGLGLLDFRGREYVTIENLVSLNDRLGRFVVLRILKKYINGLDYWQNAMLLYKAIFSNKIVSLVQSLAMSGTYLFFKHVEKILTFVHHELLSSEKSDDAEEKGSSGSSVATGEGGVEVVLSTITGPATLSDEYRILLGEDEPGRNIESGGNVETPQEETVLQDINITNFFPWIKQYIYFFQTIESRDILEHFLSDDFRLSFLAKILCTSPSEALILSTAVTRFCELLTKMKETGETKEIWPLNTSPKQLRKLGFRSRTGNLVWFRNFGKHLTNVSWLSDLSERTNEEIWKLWYRIIKAVFSNGLVSYANILQLSTWDFFKLLDPLLTQFNNFLDKVISTSAKDPRWFSNKNKDRDVETLLCWQEGKPDTDISGIQSLQPNDEKREGLDDVNTPQEGDNLPGNQESGVNLGTEQTEGSEGGPDAQQTEQNKDSTRGGFSAMSEGGERSTTSGNGSDKQTHEPEEGVEEEAEEGVKEKADSAESTSNTNPKILQPSWEELIKTVERDEDILEQIKPPARLYFHGSAKDVVWSPTYISEFFSKSGFLSKADYNFITRKVTLTVAKGEKVTLGGRLKYIYALPGEMEGEGVFSSKYCVDQFLDRRTLYVYCNLTEDIVIGERFSPVIQTVITDLDRLTRVIFHKPIFLPLRQNYASKIKFVLYTETGEKVKFLTNNQSVAKIILTRKWQARSPATPTVS